MHFFETAGNAICTIGNNKKPIISSDIWYEENAAYFGSWILSHKVPKEQRDKIDQCEYIYISHGHPDHLNLPSLKNHRNKKIILAQHYGSRIAKDLLKAGFNIITLPDGKWIDIAEDIRIMLFCNENQDSSLITEVTTGKSKHLIVNLNDSGGKGFKKELADICQKYQYSYYLQLHGYGDADMINVYDHNGKFIEPLSATKPPIGNEIYNSLKSINCKVAIPFSGFHQYQRRDSIWVNKYLTPPDAYSDGWGSEKKYVLLKPFTTVKLSDEGYAAEPYQKENLLRIEAKEIHESTFGDDWESLLSKSNKSLIDDYINSVELLKNRFAAIEFFVGGELHVVKFQNSGKKIRFSVPKGSLIKAIRTNTFDDLLIGNFMKTQCFNYKPSIYNPDFGRTLTKYSDNGGVKNRIQYQKYKKFYNSKRKAPDKISLFMRNNWNIVSNKFPVSFRTDIKRLLVSLSVSKSI